jgi:predicted ATPase/DNA-binding SARP family transcriptional activator
VEFGVLGPLQVRSGDVVVDIRRGLPRTILTYLLTRVGETARSETLADVLWGDQQPVNPSNALQTQISYLRRQLAAHTASQPIVTRPGGYALLVDRDAIDAYRFDGVVHAAASDLAAGDHHPANVLERLDTALSWWRGAALDDVAGEPFAIGEAARLEELRLTAIELRYEAALLLGRHHEVASDLAALVSEHPLREKLHAQLMLALYRSGRQADALRAFTTARDTLVDELGIEPGPELRELERRILDHDPALVPVAAEAPRQPIAAAPADPAAGRLPAAVTTLIGRDVELDRVIRLLGRGRAVTLTGPAGAGKSRLAVEAARSIAATCDVWYVDLGDVDDPTQVATEVAGALGVPSVPTDDPIRAVSNALTMRSGVLVLDTCEHVVASVAALVGRVLREAPDVRVLATSRRPLNVTGELAWPVPPLALALPDAPVEQLRDFPAIELFVQRAEAVQPDFELTDDNAADITAICMALDGLPLAIELAAARVDVLAPRLIRERLGRRFDLLVDGGRDTRARQQTLRGAIDWSIELLDDDQRHCFARLGAFSGSFDLDAAAAVTGLDDPDAVLDVMTSLVRHSMVARADSERFRLLDTLRAYALEMLDGLDADATRDRHAQHYVQVGERAELGIRGPGQRGWLDRLRSDLPNHRAALEWMIAVGDGTGAARLAGALGWFWILDGMLADACGHLEAALEFTDLRPRERAKASWSLALLVASQGDLRRAEQLAEDAMVSGQASGDPARVGYGLHARAVARWALGDLHSATQIWAEAIDQFDRSDDDWGAALCRVLRSRTAIDQGAANAGEMIAEGLAAARSTGDGHLIGIALEQVARIELRTPDPDAAIRHADDAIALHDAIGYVEGVLGARHIRGIALLASGDVDASLIEHLTALRAASAIGHRAAVCEAIEGVAAALCTQGQPERARRLARVATTARRQLDLPRRRDDERWLTRCIGDPSESPPRDGETADDLDDTVMQLLSDDVLATR